MLSHGHGLGLGFSLPKQLLALSLSFIVTLAATFAIMLPVAATVACNSTTALADAEKFEPIVINALNLACAISANPVCASTATITKDYNTVITLWTAYNAAVANGTSTSAMWNDLNAAFIVFEQDSALVFSFASGLNAPEITAIVAAAQLLLGAIEALFPSAPAGTVVQVKAHLFAKYSRSANTYNADWLKEWCKDYNERVDIAHHEYPNVKLTKVHYHGKLARVVSFGISN